jgi:D-alanyl-D-alanine dipeptidase
MLLIFLGLLALNSNPTGESTQMLLSLANNWEATTGYLQKFERKTCKDNWRPVGKKIPVSFGKNGLGWGIGLHNKHLPDYLNFSNNPRVFEGSKRSPVGVFALNLAFGKANKTNPDVKNIKLPYTQITEHHWVVDDVKSKYYNRVVDDQIVKKDWDSAIYMKKYIDEGLGEFNILIEHNYQNPIPGKGSCFMIHVHRGPGFPTAGCTAFAREQVKEIINWLNPNKKPIFVQLPLDVFNFLKKIWALPDF